MQPKIGVTLDYKEEKTYAQYPWVALRHNYATSLIEAGAAPFGLLPDPALVTTYLDSVDGLLVSGGFFDVDPTLYGEETSSDTVKPVPTRTQFEFSIIKEACARDMPILGICGGEQILNVVLGGTLVQHIPDSYENCLEHEQKTPHHETSHAVRVEERTLLARIVGDLDFDVNSSHHQAVGKPGKGVVINAYAPDGVVEGIEVPGLRFCLGVEWHPEYKTTNQDSKIMQAFVDACRVK